jgi:hypothetical protein
MNRRKLESMRKVVESRGGRMWINPEADPAAFRMMFEGLLDCPDCRAAILEACNSDDRKNVNIDETLASLAMSCDHWRSSRRRSGVVIHLRS